MTRFLIWGLVIYLIFRLVRKKRELPAATESKAEETYRDPVCGVYVPAGDAVVGNLEGRRIHFCSRECLDKFSEDPAKY